MHYKDQAIRGCDALMKLLGTEWKPDVWENLGWHYGATSPCKRVQIRPLFKPPFKLDGYTAYLNNAGEGGGRFVGRGATPQAAIHDAVEQARMEILHLEKMVEGL